MYLGKKGKKQRFKPLKTKSLMTDYWLIILDMLNLQGTCLFWISWISKDAITLCLSQTNLSKDFSALSA